MVETMNFPKNWEDFIDDYSFLDRDKIYTNGIRLIPVFRVRQCIEHYFLDGAAVDKKTRNPIIVKVYNGTTGEILMEEGF